MSHITTIAIDLDTIAAVITESIETTLRPHDADIGERGLNFIIKPYDSNARRERLNELGRNIAQVLAGFEVHEEQDSDRVELPSVDDDAHEQRVAFTATLAAQIATGWCTGRAANFPSEMGDGVATSAVDLAIRIINEAGRRVK